MRLKIVSGRDGKNLDSTDNIKRGIKKRREGGDIFFKIYHMRGVKKFSLMLTDVNNETLLVVDTKFMITLWFSLTFVIEELTSIVIMLLNQMSPT